MAVVLRNMETKMISDDKKFWHEASKYCSDVDILKLRGFFDRVSHRANFRLRAGGLEKDKGPTIQVLANKSIHGIRNDIVLIGVEVQRRHSRVKFWVQLDKHSGLDLKLEKCLRGVLSSRERKWHYFDASDLNEQIQMAEAALDEVDDFSIT